MFPVLVRQRFARDIYCKVYTAVRQDYEVPGYPRQPAVFEYFFLDVSVTSM